MLQNKNYTGLTDAQVLESRKKYGVNILTPPEKETLWDTLKEACTHWITKSMLVLLVLSVIGAAMLSSSLGGYCMVYACYYCSCNGDDIGCWLLWRFR